MLSNGDYDDDTALAIALALSMQETSGQLDPKSKGAEVQKPLFFT